MSHSDLKVQEPQIVEIRFRHGFENLQNSLFCNTKAGKEVGKN